MEIICIALLRYPPSQSQAFVDHDLQPVAKLTVRRVNDAPNNSSTRTSWCMYLRDVPAASGASSSSIPIFAKSCTRSSRFNLKVDKKFLILSGNIRHGMQKCIKKRIDLFHPRS